MRKKIGVLGWKIGANSFGITLPYFRYIAQYGEIVVLEPDNEVRADLDLLILPGGADLDTTQYKLDRFNIDIGKPCPLRTYFMENKLSKYIKANVPLFGICLGHQMLAAYTGNKLIPDMYHETNAPDERHKTVHDIAVVRDYSQKFQIKDVLKVNSIHHQAICSENIINADIVATHKRANKSSVGQREIEALKYNDFRGYSVQWHPEEIYDEMSHKMIIDLLNV